MKFLFPVVTLKHLQWGLWEGCTWFLGLEFWALFTQVTPGHNG